MKKRWTRILSVLLTLTMVLGSTVTVSATSAVAPVDTDAESEVIEGSALEEAVTNGAAQEAAVSTDVAQNQAAAEASKEETPKTEAPEAEGAVAATKEPNTQNAATEEIAGSVTVDSTDVSGNVTVDNTDVSGTVTVEPDKNDDNVEIKKNDKPYLALGANLTPEQQATVLSLMGIDSSKLAEYDVVYVNNEEEHQYLGAYIDSNKIGTKSLSSIVIVEREKGNGINISTNNISYCTVGMYKNALATAGIEDADIIVAGPFPISGTAALVGIFKAYEEMTGDKIDEENMDAALNELVVTGELSAGGADSDEIEGMIAYVKQAVVEHDLSSETDIRKAIAEACDKFDITMTEEEITEVVKLMLKIGELDLDLDSLLNSAQSIYDKISTADSGFWAKIRELLQTIVEKMKELF